MTGTLKSASEGAGIVGWRFRILYCNIFYFRYAMSCASEDGRSLMGGSDVVHCGVVEWPGQLGMWSSMMTWPTRQHFIVSLDMAGLF